MVEWREVKTRAETSDNRVDQARAAVRMLELEVELIEDFRLALPPETEPLDDSAWAEHTSRRTFDLLRARNELTQAQRALSRGR